jgi:hypothetical protein
VVNRREDGHESTAAAPPPAGPSGLAGVLHRVCTDAARELSAVGVGVSVMTSDGSFGMAAASNAAAARIEELQLTLGEGPCVDAFAVHRPVFMPDLDGPVAARWPMYTPAVAEVGVRAAFAFPLQIGAARLGVLDVYRDRPGPLSRVELGDAFRFTDQAIAALLDGQERGSTEGDGFADVFDPGAELFQAQGMAMVQIGVPLAEALVRIRAHAFVTGRPLRDVAADIVARRLYLDHNSGEGSS